MKKAIKVISYALFLLTFMSICFLGIKYFNEIRTLSSLKPVDGTNLYTMEYFSDYYFDDFLIKGAADNKEYYEYINNLFNEPLGSGIANTSVKDACSAFTFKGKDGSRCLARNFDYTANPVMLIVTSPENAYKSISTVNMNCMGYNAEKAPKSFDFKLFGAPYFPTDGMNENGISISLLQVNFARKQKEENKSTLSVYAVNRLVLDYADSIDSAVELIDKYNIYFDSSLMAHFFIADKYGNSALIEFVNGEMLVIKNDKSYQIASNFNNTEEVFDDEGYVYTKQYRQWLRESGTGAYDSEYSGYIRYDYMLDTLYNNSGILTEDDAFKLLENVASPSKLQYSVIYNMENLQATVITDNDWEKRTTAALSASRQ